MEGIQKIHKGADKLDDRGFSLIELIIVIAIMAVLLGVVGAQVVPYMESAKRSKDAQVLSAFATAGMTAYSLHADSAPATGTMEIEINPDSGGDLYSCPAAPDIAAQMKALVGKDYVSNAAVLFESRHFKATRKIVVTYDFGSRTISVRAFDGTGVLIPCEHDVLGRL